MNTVFSKPPLMTAIRNAEDPDQIIVYRSTEIGTGHRIMNQLCEVIGWDWSVERRRPPRKSVMLGGEAVLEFVRIHQG